MFNITRVVVPFFKVLENVDLIFPPTHVPQIFQIGGNSGCGKTTLLSLIYRVFHDKSAKFYEELLNNFLKMGQPDLGPDLGNEETTLVEIHFDQDGIEKVIRLTLQFVDADSGEYEMCVHRRPFKSTHDVSLNMYSDGDFDVIPRYKLFYAPCFSDRISSFPYDSTKLSENFLSDLMGGVTLFHSLLESSPFSVMLGDITIQTSSGENPDGKYTYKAHLYSSKLGRNVEYHELSFGERQLIELFLWLKMVDVRGGIVLLDNPDLGLHPDQQYELTIELQSLLGNETQIIIATHSYELCHALTPSHVLILD